jgi:hypothetical protein
MRRFAILSFCLLTTLFSCRTSFSQSTLTFGLSGLTPLPLPAVGAPNPAYTIAQQGTINDINQARNLVTYFATQIHATDPQCSADNSSFIINLVTFNYKAGDQPGLLTGIMQSSKWYIYEGSQNSFVDATAQTGRIYGSTKPYVIAIHVNVQYVPVTPPAAGAPIPLGYIPNPGYTLKYPYTVTHRAAANLADVQAAISLYQSLTAKAGGAVGTKSYGTFWAWDQMTVNTPANISIAAAVQTNNPAAPPALTTVTLDAKPVTYNDEGFYHWDVSVGVPITSYSQVEDVFPQTSTTTPASPVPATVDKRNLFLMADWYIKPVDLSGNKPSYIPYPVVGVSLASQPLHAVVGAVGVGFSTAALYIGSMAITSDVNGGTVRHYKLAFGLNLPVRTIMGKLGINTQIASGGS